MILRQGDRLAVLTNNATGIARVATIDVRRCDQNYIGGAPCLISKVLTRYVVRILATISFELLPAIGTEEHFVDLDEDSGKGLLIILSLEGWICL